MSKISILLTGIIWISCSSPQSELTKFTYSTCKPETADSEFTPPKLVESKIRGNEAIITITGTANCGADLIGKFEKINNQISLFYTVEGLDFDEYAPKPPPEPIVQTPEPVEIDSNTEIKEVLLNLCYCRYTLNYSITNPPSGFKISSVNKWKIE